MGEQDSKAAMGRPKEDLYKKWIAGKEDEIIRYCEEGADLKGIAKLLGCGLTTLKSLKKMYPEFAELMKKANEVADEEIVSALYKRAKGYDAEDTITEVRVDPGGSAQTTYVRKTKRHIPADLGAMVFWLKNRRPEEWRDKQDVELESQEPISITIVKDSGSQDKPQ